MSFSQNKISVKFIVETNNYRLNDSIYISGNKHQLGNWNPSKIPLQKVSESRWEKVIDFEAGTLIELKFTKGSWTNEAVDVLGIVPQNYSVLVDRDTTLTYNINHWKNEFETEAKGQITGTVKYHKDLKGTGIQSRDIIVWLPPSYYSNDSIKYPVLYLHDGQNIFDPTTASFGTDWRIDETADSLIKENKIKEIIIVGIYNTSDRSTEYTYSDTGHLYMNFIINNLKPFIDKEYRTLSDRKNTATAGSSLGGLISFIIAWEFPEVFSKAACISPAFHIDNIDYVSIVKKYKGPKKNIKIYIDNGGIGLELKLQPGIEEMISMLKEKGFEEGEDLEIHFDKGAGHSETDWGNRAWRFLTFFFRKE